MPANRLLGLDIAKVLAILLLFPVHSGLAQIYPQYVNLLQYFFLGVFFYVAGYLAHPEKKPALSFMKDKLVDIYVPFAVFVLAYHTVQNVRFHNSILVDVTGLSLYAPYTLDAYHLWFVPLLLLLFVLTVALYRRPLLLVSATFAILLFQVATNFSVLDWKVPIFAVVYLAGYLDTLNGVSSMLLLVGFGSSLAVLPQNGAPQGMVLGIATTLLMVLPVMKVLARLRARGTLLEVIAGSTLFIYLVEPFASTFLAESLYGTPYAESIGPPDLWGLILLRIAVATVLGVVLGATYRRLGSLVPRAAHRTMPEKARPGLARPARVPGDLDWVGGVSLQKAKTSRPALGCQPAPGHAPIFEFGQHREGRQARRRSWTWVQGRTGDV